MILEKNARELALIAREIGADVLEGALLIYPNETLGWQIGDTDLSEYLDQYRGQKVIIIVAPLGKAQKQLRLWYQRIRALLLALVVWGV
jgi:hypothetical protein